MKSHTPKSSREDVLDAFAVEPNTDRETLERYLREYPQFAVELVDLSRELWRNFFEDEVSLSAEDQQLIDMAWQRHREAKPKDIADPFATMTVAELRELARHLGVPRQVVSAFRERKVNVASIPQRFLSQFAAVMNSNVEQLVNVLSQPPATSVVRSYKADVKPKVNTLITFEQLLIDSGIPDEKRAILMADN